MVKTVHDTTIVIHSDTVRLTKDKLVYVKSEKVPLESLPVKYIPKEHPDSLAKQYGELLTEHTTKRLYLDTLRIDSIGWVAVEDSVQFNQLQARKYTYSIQERKIKETTTITHTIPPKNLFFVGLEADAEQDALEDLKIGLMLKNRKDNMIGVAVGYNFQNKVIIYSAKYYTKLHL